MPGNDVDSGEKLMTGDKKCGRSLIVLVINPLIAPQIYMILNIRYDPAVGNVHQEGLA